MAGGDKGGLMASWLTCKARCRWPLGRRGTKNRLDLSVSNGHGRWGILGQFSQHRAPAAGHHTGLRGRLSCTVRLRTGPLLAPAEDTYGVYGGGTCWICHTGVLVASAECGWEYPLCNSLDRSSLRSVFLGQHGKHHSPNDHTANGI